MEHCYVMANASGYSVIEKQSELILFQSRSKRAAAEVLKCISAGAGFEGSTPMFFAIGKKETSTEVKEAHDAEQNLTGTSFGVTSAIPVVLS